MDKPSVASPVCFRSPLFGRFYCQILTVVMTVVSMFWRCVFSTSALAWCLIREHRHELWTKLAQVTLTRSVEAGAMAGPPVVIWKREVEALLKYRELIPRLEEALGKFSRRDSAQVIQPVRTTVALQKHSG